MIPTELPTPTKAPALTLSPDASTRDAFLVVARSCLAHADANEPAVGVDADPEGLHQLRVAYRRLRSALSLHRAVCRADPDAQDLKDRLRKPVTVPFGASRDSDVFVEAHEDLDGIAAERLEGLRREAYLAVTDTLAAPAWQTMRRDFEDWLVEAPLGSRRPGSARRSAAAAMALRRRRIARQGRDLAALSSAARHEVRIEAKKLRYAYQFYGSLWPGHEAQVWADERALALLQDQLGLLNDALTWAAIRVAAGIHTPDPPVDVERTLASAQHTWYGIVGSGRYWRGRGAG